MVTNALLKAALQLLTFDRAEIFHTFVLDIVASIVHKHVATSPAVKQVLLTLPNMTPQVRPELFMGSLQQILDTERSGKILTIFFARNLCPFSTVSTLCVFKHTISKVLAEG